MLDITESTSRTQLAKSQKKLLQKKLIELSRLRFDLTGILPLEIRGFLKQGPSKANADVTVILPKVPLTPIVYHFLQEPYKTEKPFYQPLRPREPFLPNSG